MKLPSPFAGKSIIIMDYDGTIADTRSVHASAFRRALQEFAVPFDYENYEGWRTEDVVRDVLKKLTNEVTDVTVRGIVLIKQEYASNEFRKRLPLIPGADSFIARASLLGYRLAMATGASVERITTAMAHPSLEGRFEAVVTAEDVLVGKPDPATYLAVLSRMKGSASESIVIEDAYSGVLSAIQAGIDVVCINEECEWDEMSHNMKAVKMNYSELEGCL